MATFDIKAYFLHHHQILIVHKISENSKKFFCKNMKKNNMLLSDI